MNLVDFVCPECGHVEHQPATARNVYRRCPATGRTEAYQRDPEALRRAKPVPVPAATPSPG